jgi:predicted outer membrane protein
MPAAEYVKTAGASDLYERQSSQVVLETTADPKVRSFAQMMLTAHAKSTADVKAAAMRSKVPVAPPKLTLAQAEMIAQLRAEKYADGIVAQVYKANRDEKDALGDRLLEKYIEPISKEIADMRVREAQTGAAVDCLAKSTSMRFDNVYREIECAKKECGAAIALEGERRVNGDQSIMCYVQGTYVPGKLVMPRDAICPEVMQRYNSWTAPTTPAPDTQAVTGSVQSQTN